MSLLRHTRGSPSPNRGRRQGPGKTERPMFRHRASQHQVGTQRGRAVCGLASLNGHATPCHAEHLATPKVACPKWVTVPCNLQPFPNSKQGIPFLHLHPHWSLPLRLTGQTWECRHEDRYLACRNAHAARHRRLTHGAEDLFPTQTLKQSSFDNDPSAGSPTETLLRLLLPLNDQV